MDSHQIWEKYYRKTPLEKIPWQKTQADYFTKLIDSDRIKIGTALDLGCGTGMKSIYLAQKGFKVIGIDISKTAIKIAKENALKAGVEIDFLVADATDLSFLRDKIFDFILDWANLHGIPQNKRKEYVREVTKHIKQGGLLLLRCFARKDKDRNSVQREMGRIYSFSREDIKKLYGEYFKILEMNRSKPFITKVREPPARYLDEYLLERL